MNLKEIEKKYTVKYLPKNMKVEKIQEIEQIYLYKDKRRYWAKHRIDGK